MSSMGEIEDLRRQAESLRDDALRHADAWDAEKRESKRLHAAVVRYKNLVAELEREVGELRTTLENESERAGTAEQFVEILRARVDELIPALDRYGEHTRDCRKRSLFKKKKTECTCGLDSFIAGGGSISD